MLLMKKICLLPILILFSLAAKSQTFEDDIKHLMKATGSETNVNSMVSYMIDTFKEQETYKNIPDEFWTEFSKEIKESYIVLENKLIIIYKQHYTREEVKALIAFYESPLGKTMIKKTPLVLSESYKAGSDWGRELGEKVAKKLQEKKD